MIDELYTLCKNPPSLKDWRRFWSKVKVKDWKRCWEWQNGKHSKGYGQFYSSKVKTTRKAHRVICEWLYGDLPLSLVVDHIWCNNPPCCNPLHLIPTAWSINTMRIGSKNIMAIKASRLYCKFGHQLTVVQNGLRRRCLPCGKEQLKRWKNNNIKKSDRV